MNRYLSTDQPGTRSSSLLSRSRRVNRAVEAARRVGCGLTGTEAPHKSLPHIRALRSGLLNHVPRVPSACRSPQAETCTPRRPPGAMGIADKLRSLSLPGNWQVRTDEEGNQFYWNSHTFKKQSTRPKALGLGWREQRDHETGEVYVYNILTRQSQAAPPERQVQRPPPEIVPPPPTVEMYEESVRQRRQTMLEESTKTSPADVSVRTSSMREPSQAFHTHRAAAKAGVPVAVDPFSLRNRAGCKTLCGPAWPSCAQPACGSSAPAEMTVLLPKSGARWGSSQAGTQNGAELKPPGPPPGAPPGPPPGAPPGGPPGALPAVAESDSPGGSDERATAKAGQPSPQTSAVRASRPRPSHPPSSLCPFAHPPRPALAPVRPINRNRSAPGTYGEARAIYAEEAFP